MTLRAITPRRLILTLAALLLGCGDDIDETRFACGDHGGSCDRDTEICIIGDGECSTCAPKPAACDPETTCGCQPPGTDAAYGDHKCTDAGTCEMVDGGLVLSCAADGWGCG